MTDDEQQITTADMLEVYASGGNGAEYVNAVWLLEKAAKELREKDAEIDRLRAEAMSREPTDAMCEAAVSVIRQAMAGCGAPFEFPDVEHAYDIYAAMRRAALEGRKDG